MVLQLVDSNTIAKEWSHSSQDYMQEALRVEMKATHCNHLWENYQSGGTRVDMNIRAGWPSCEALHINPDFQLSTMSTVWAPWRWIWWHAFLGKTFFFFCMRKQIEKNATEINGWHYWNVAYAWGKISAGKSHCYSSDTSIHYIVNILCVLFAHNFFFFFLMSGCLASHYSNLMNHITKTRSDRECSVFWNQACRTLDNKWFELTMKLTFAHYAFYSLKT